MDMKRLEAQIAFLMEADKLKNMYPKGLRF